MIQDRALNATRPSEKGKKKGKSKAPGKYSYQTSKLDKVPEILLESISKKILRKREVQRNPATILAQHSHLLILTSSGGICKIKKIDASAKWSIEFRLPDAVPLIWSEAYAISEKETIELVKEAEFVTKIESFSFLQLGDKKEPTKAGEAAKQTQGAE